MGRLIEGFWDCPYCDHKRISGLVKVCPNCNKPRGDLVKFYMDGTKNYISEEKAKTISRNPDWVCSFCDSLNSDDVTICHVCNASKADSERNYFENQKKLQEQKKRMEQIYANSDAMKEDDSPIAKETERSSNTSSYNQDYLDYHPTYPTQNNSFATPAKKKNSIFKSKKFWGISAIVLASILLITGLVFLFLPKQAEGVVDGFSWERSISIEEYKTFQESDWSLPPGARLERTQTEIRGYEQVLDHYETKTRTYTEEVLDHYETVVVGYRDLGNGTFEEITEQKAVYRTETKTETYQDPVYRDEPIYATKYYYEIDRWTHSKYVKSSGNDKEPYWETYICKDKEREGTKSETYKITIVTDDGKQETYTLDFNVWNNLNKGDKVKLKVHFGGKAEIITD